jgi:putative heme-binding domain-containing protein
VQERAGLVPASERRAVLARLAGSGWDAAPVALVLEGLARGLEADAGPAPEPLAAAEAAWLAGLIEGEPGPLRRAAWRAGRAFGLPATARQRALLAEAALVAGDRSRPLAERVEALALFELAPGSQRLPVLLGLLGPRDPGELQRAALAQLSRSRHPGLGAGLLAAWPELEPGVRDAAVRILLRRRENHALLLDALEGGRVTLGELNLHLERRRALLVSPDPEIRRRAEAFFSDAGVVTREEALRKMRPALERAGDARAGRVHFEALCARCHRLGGLGVAIGPDLSHAVHKSPETLLHDIVDPNAATETTWVSYSVETVDGRILSGLLRDETDESLSILNAGGEITEVRRDRIQRLWTGGLSLMPEELEAGLEPGAMADLLAYLRDPG